MARARILVSILLATAGALAIAQLPQAAPDYSVQNALRQMGVDQNLGAQVPADAEFKDEAGKTVHIGDYFGKRPILLMPIFYTCKSSCDVEQHALLQTAAKLRNTYPVGERFDVLMVSINPEEGPADATKQKLLLTSVYDRPASEKGWHLLTGSLDNIMKVTAAIGFRWSYDPVSKRINHPASLMMLTPEGKVSNYLFGAVYPEVILRNDVDTAAQKKIGTKTEVILLGCIMVDPSTNYRSLIIWRVLTGMCILTVVAMVAGIWGMVRKTKQEEELAKQMEMVGEKLVDGGSSGNV